MYCCACAQPTEGAPCSACGAEPLLDGRYRLEQAIGKGSAGTTWLAERVADGVRVAVKESVLRREHVDKANELIEREARVLRQLSHPAVPAYVEHLRTGTGRTRSFWLVQEFVDGVDLERGLADHRYTEAEVLVVIDELCGVLGYLHGLSPPVVHRDLKPSNVIRTPEGKLVLVDFGSVRDVLKDEVGGSTVAGTFGYMAPEQFAGDASPRSDLYALGALAVALLTRSDPAKLQAHDRRLDWYGRASASPATRALIDDLLQPDPARRPPGAEAARDRIRQVMRSLDRKAEAPTLPPSSSAPTPTSPPRAHAPRVEAPTLDPVSAAVVRERGEWLDPEPFVQPLVRHERRLAASPPPPSPSPPVGRALITGAAIGLLGVLGLFLFVPALVVGGLVVSRPTSVASGPVPVASAAPGNVAACFAYVHAFNHAPCVPVTLNTADLCPPALDGTPCDMVAYYECMAGAVRCDGDFIDISGQADCPAPVCD